jgi:hypothetical protein
MPQYKSLEFDIQYLFCLGLHFAMRALNEGQEYSSERMLHKDYDLKSSPEKISGRDPQGAWRKDELIVVICQFFN